MNDKIKSTLGIALVGLSVLMSYATFLNIPNVAGQLSWLSGAPATFVAAGISDFVANHSIPLLGIALVAVMFLAKSPMFKRIAVLVFAVTGPFLGLLSSAIWASINPQNAAQSFFGFWEDGLADFAIRTLAVYPALAGAVLIFLSLGKISSKQPAAATANRFDPETGQPIAAPVATGVLAAPAATDGLPLSNLPQLAFILGIVAPLVGVIIGYVALNQMNTGVISRANEKQARNGILIGFILMGVSVIASIILIVVSVIFAASAFNSYGY